MEIFVECLQVPSASDLKDLFGGFGRHRARDERGCAAHRVELPFDVIELPGPEVDVSVNDDPGQRFGLLKGAAEGGGAVGLQDLGWVASGGQVHGGRVAGDREQDAMCLNGGVASGAVAI